MAGSVRIAGPEFSDARSRAAFARIEESIRQFTSHSRENIALVRNPLALSDDHFVVLWSKGAAVCGLVHQGGRIRGGMQDDWNQESLDRATSSDFDNPLPQLQVARKELLGYFQTILPTKRIGSSVEPVVAEDHEDDPVLSVIAEQSGQNDKASRLAAFEHCTRGIVILTPAIDRVRIENISESKELAVIALDQAVTRTIFHLPNLLRVIDFETSFFTPDEVTKVADVLEQEAEARAPERVQYTAPVPKLKQRRSPPKGAGKWIALAIAIAVAVGLFTFLGKDKPDDQGNNGPDTPIVKPDLPKPKTESSILLILPTETQAFISPIKFETRADLLQGIGAGQGTRMFPKKEQVIRFDSVQFATGVYGYFKVEGSWRRGKLLQTLRSGDTVMIENFLPPLP